MIGFVRCNIQMMFLLFGMIFLLGYLGSSKNRICSRNLHSHYLCGVGSELTNSCSHSAAGCYLCCLFAVVFQSTSCGLEIVRIEFISPLPHRAMCRSVSYHSSLYEFMQSTFQSRRFSNRERDYNRLINSLRSKQMTANKLTTKGMKWRKRSVCCHLDHALWELSHPTVVICAYKIACSACPPSRSIPSNSINSSSYPHTTYESSSSSQ
jgi:hypothetical protein